MTPKGFGRYLVAYVAGTLTIIPVALAGAGIADWFDYHVTFWQVGLPVWLLVVGIPSVGWSSRNIGKTLGIRETPTLHVGGQRNIPVVGGALGDVTRAVLGAPARPAAVAVAEEITVTCGDYVFTEGDLLPVLRRAWVRQRSGDHPLSREYWLDKTPFLGDRDKYDAFALALEACGILIGRKVGASGKLAAPPLTAINELRHKPYDI